jgi:mercury(II) reductase
MSEPIITPWDRHNQELTANVHPPDWVNPEPSGRYNLVVIGAGTAGLVAAAGAAALGAKVALIERHLMGGDCLNVGCVPSKTLIRSARAATEVRNAAEFGVVVPDDGVTVDFTSVMERVRALRAEISKHDSAKRFRELGVDVFLGQGRFLDRETIEVEGKTLRFKRAVIATGGRPAHPKVEGLNDSGFLTNETVFSLTEQPARLAVIGGGPIGCELAQAFQRLGSKVTVLHKNTHLLDREDAHAADIIQRQFAREGIQLALGASLERVRKTDKGKLIHFRFARSDEEIEVDEILVAAGRVPNVESLNLEAAEVRFDSREGVCVNDYLQTSNRRIYAAGDVCMKWKFTHAADAAARLVLQNALFVKSSRVSTLTMPWCTYTDPEIAHVGLYEHEAKEQGIEVDTYTQPMEKVDRAITDDDRTGFVKIHVYRDTNRIAGATVVARHAGEMISEIAVAMAGKLRLTDLANVIHPYPTQAEAVRKCADASNRARLTPAVKAIVGAWLRWQRRF